MDAILQELSKPFHPSMVKFLPGSVRKDGTKALALAYADLRAYMRRLDQVLGLDWQVTYSPWGDGRIVASISLSVDGKTVTRSSVGETTSESQRGEIAGTVAEAQAFKRAAAMFGLGRYLYDFPQEWEEFDNQRRQFTPAAKARLQGQVVRHYQSAGQPEGELSSIDLLTEEDLDPAGPPAASNGDLYSAAAIRTGAASQMAKGGKEATAKMLQRLEEDLTEYLGDKVKAADFMRDMAEGSDMNMALAGELLAKIGRKVWDKDAGKYVPNTGLDAKLVKSIKQHWG